MSLLKNLFPSSSSFAKYKYQVTFFVWIKEQVHYIHQLRIMKYSLFLATTTGFATRTLTTSSTTTSTTTLSTNTLVHAFTTAVTTTSRNPRQVPVSVSSLSPFAKSSLYMSSSTSTTSTMMSDTLMGAQSMIDAILDEKNCGPVMVRLAWHDSGTYDVNLKDEAWPKAGGAIGSIRFAPEITHGANAGLSNAIAILEPVKTAFPNVSYADIFQMASARAIELAGGPKIDMKYVRYLFAVVAVAVVYVGRFQCVLLALFKWQSCRVCQSVCVCVCIMSCVCVTCVYDTRCPPKEQFQIFHLHMS
jgi:Peroxidase